MSDEPSALGVALEIAAVLERHGLSYAVGGALAYGLWGVPRGTLDVDINVFLEDARLVDLGVALADLGVALDVGAATAASEAAGLIIVQHRQLRVDLFTPSIPFAWEAERTRVRCTVRGQDAWFLSAEATAVFKLLFFRPKDIVDMQRLVAVQGDRLDVAYVRRWLVEMVGDDDERVARLDRLVADHLA